MARGRMINRKVATSEKVATYGDEYGPWAVVFHHRIIAFLDVNGCCRADPYWLKAEIFPRVSGVTPEDCRRFAAGLERHGLAVLYEEGGMAYLHMPGFRGEQVGLRVDRESPEVPVPDGFDDKSGKFPATFRQPSGYLPAEVEGEVEVEGTTTGSIDPEAAPRGETPPEGDHPPPTEPSPSSPVDAHPGQRPAGEPPPGPALGARLAPLIREHLWLGDRPPSRGWDMGRELSVASRLVKQGVTVDQLAGAIEHARDALQLDTSTPFTLRIFLTKDRRDRLEAATAAWRRAEMRKASTPQRIADDVDRALAVVGVARV